MQIPKKLTENLAKPKKIVVVSHRNPDGDAIGSSLALTKILQQFGHNITCVLPNQLPDFLTWVPHLEEVMFFDNHTSEVKNLVENADIIFTLDFNHLSRVGNDFQEVLEKFDGKFVMIDHHQEPDSYAEFVMSNPAKASTCEMVYDFIDELGATNKITPAIASLLYLGIMTDTGSFRFPSTTSQTHRTIANLIDYGATNWKIHQETFDGNSYDRMQLLGRALSKMKVIESEKTAYIPLKQEDLDEFNFKKGDTEGFVNYALSLKGIIFAVIFIENSQDKLIKISFRSKGDFDVNTFARQHFEGGGHKNAAGGRSFDSLTNTVNKFLGILPDYSKELKNDA